MLRPGSSASSRPAADACWSRRSFRAKSHSSTSPRMMRRLLAALFFVPLLGVWLAPLGAQPAQPPQVIGRAWMLVDLSSGQVLAAEKPDERFEPASLTKLMTAYLVFAALKAKKLAADQQIAVSERAWRAPGSRMFIEPRRPVTVDELLRGLVVQSGNDAC